MGKEDVRLDARKAAVKKWLSNPTNILLVLVLVLAFSVRLYYLSVTAEQALWWDEAEYMATAKHWALDVPYDLNPQRPPLFQLLGALLIALGFGDVFLKFALVIVPALGMTFATYWVGKTLYDKRTGVFAAAGIAFIWSFIFWSVRFQPDFFSVMFQLLAVGFYWKALTTKSTKAAVYAGTFAALGFYFKITALLVPIAIGIFVLCTEGLGFLRRKYHWAAIGAYAVTMLPFLLWQFILFGNPIAFAPSYAGAEYRAGRELGWMALDYFYSFPKVLFFLLFLAGLAIFMGSFMMSLDMYIKNKQRKPNPGLFSFILLALVAGFYIFFTKGIIEDRWVFIIAPFLMLFAARGALALYDVIEKRGKALAVLFIIFIFAVFMYAQLQHTQGLIMNKKDSYLPVKESGLWMKENSAPSDVLVSASFTQITAYAERETKPFSASKNASDFDLFIETRRPKYLMVSVFETHPPWLNDWLQANQGRLVPVQAYFADQAQQQTLLVVYGVRYDQ